MTTTGDPKKIQKELDRENRQNYASDNDAPHAPNNEPIDIDDLHKRVFGNVHPEKEPLDLVGEITKDENDLVVPVQNTKDPKGPAFIKPDTPPRDEDNREPDL